MLRRDAGLGFLFFIILHYWIIDCSGYYLSSVTAIDEIENQPMIYVPHVQVFGV